MLGPVIKLEHVTLRPMKKKDLPIYVKGLQNPNVIRYLTLSKAPTIEEEEKWFKETKESKSEIHWAISCRNRCIGGISLKDHDIFLQTTEMGYLIHDENFWGKGLMTEAAKAIRNYGFTKLNLETMFISAINENIGSRKIITKLGFKKIGEFPHKLFRDNRWHDGAMYIMLKNEWEDIHAKKDINTIK